MKQAIVVTVIVLMTTGSASAQHPVFTVSRASGGAPIGSQAHTYVNGYNPGTKVINYQVPGSILPKNPVSGHTIGATKLSGASGASGATKLSGASGAARKATGGAATGGAGKVSKATAISIISTTSVMPTTAHNVDNAEQWAPCVFKIRGKEVDKANEITTMRRLHWQRIANEERVTVTVYQGNRIVIAFEPE